MQRRQRALSLGCRPLHGIDEDLPHFGPIIVIIGFVAGREVEDLALANRPTHTHAARFGLAVGPGVDAVERDGFRCRDSKGLAVTLDLRKFEALYPFADGMVRLFD